MVKGDTAKLKRQLKNNTETLKNIAHFQKNPTTARSKQNYKSFKNVVVKDRKNIKAQLSANQKRR